SSPAGPSGPAGSRWAYPASAPPSVSSRSLAPGSSPYRRCSRTCSDSGITPSAVAAASTRLATCAASAPVTAVRTSTGPAGRSGVGMGRHRGAGPAVPGALAVPGRVRAPATVIGRRAAAVRPCRGPGRRDEPVADVAHGADHLLVLGAELRAQPPDVHVDRAGAAE